MCHVFDLIKNYNFFYRCAVRFEIYAVHTLTNKCTIYQLG